MHSTTADIVAHNKAHKNSHLGTLKKRKMQVHFQSHCKYEHRENKKRSSTLGSSHRLFHLFCDTQCT